MEKLDIYIADLLQKHDCVVLPDFGGFLLNSVPAGFAGSAHEIFPPSKAISFNRYLTQNDGLLAQYIANLAHVPYQDALNTVQDEVLRIKARLAAQYPVIFNGIGVITRGAEGQYIFTPDRSMNFLPESFGMTALLLSPVDARQNTPRTIRLPERPKAARDPKVRRFSPARAITAAASVAACLVIAAMVYLQNEQINPAQVAKAVYKTENVHHTAQPEAKNIIAAPAPQPAATQQASFMPSLSSAMFYVVGGAFKKESNARTFMQRLQKKGFQAQILNTENGFYRVTYYTERDSARADEALHRVKASEDRGAWLLKW